MRNLVLFCLITGCFYCKRAEVAQEQLDFRLIEAAALNLPEVLDSCLLAGANPNARDMEGTPALIFAVNSGNPYSVEQLLKKGAQANASRWSYYGSTALMESSVNNDTTIARMLIKAGANVHQKDSLGDTAMNWASYYGHQAFVGLLLEEEASWQENSAFGNALDIAAKQWHYALMDYFIEKGAGERRTEQEKALILAVKNQDLAAVKKYLNQGQSPDLKDELGTPVLTSAAAKGYAAIVSYLLESGADPNAFNRAGQTALAAAARFGQIAAVENLLAYRANPNACGAQYGLTPLMGAAIGGHVEVGRLLIEKGASVDAQETVDGFSALMFATAFGYADFVYLLIEHQANPYLKGTAGNSLFELIHFAQNDTIKRLIEAYVMNRQE
ncbi:MAG TPA: ankyrin repeat domain-containing protein [Saprospiraceae bacterium]|nr:ankyrin repeat domain-containing protein [Saprospiraceae bacterium]HMQ83343.1 ankyrin repeat domain-containing protein [Saprospiraceae bacterium]